MSLYSAMVNAGLGRAMKDSNKKDHRSACTYHAKMLKLYAWKFCPHCGVELKIVAYCEKCDRDFTSMEAFKAHAHESLRGEQCNKCHSTNVRKDASGRRHGKFICNDCGYGFQGKSKDVSQ